MALVPLQFEYMKHSHDLGIVDRSCIWHPFTQMQEYMREDPVIIARGEGIKLIDTEGKEYYDGISSLWVNIHGHRIPEIDQAITEQLSQIAHTTLLGLANIPSIKLAKKLLQITPKNLTKVFYSDSGSEAVEIGLKIAYQYWQLRGETKRKIFISMTNAYHGDTLGATSVGGMDLFHAQYQDLLFNTLYVPYPYPYRYPGTPQECSESILASLEKLLATRSEEIIGLIVEPMVQGASGIIVMPEEFLKGVESICREYSILLLTDEVATGFGRTGKLFACEHEKVQPDILMLAKGLTGGYLPLAATLCTEDIFTAFLGKYEEKKTFFHGHSYTGNPLGCAAAIANLDLIEKHNLVDQVQQNAAFLSPLLDALELCQHVGEVRRKGLMIGIELVKDQASKEPFPWEEKMGIKVCQRCRELGMILRPLGNVVVFMPPLASTKADLEEMMSILTKAIETASSRFLRNCTLLPVQ